MSGKGFFWDFFLESFGDFKKIILAALIRSDLNIAYLDKISNFSSIFFACPMWKFTARHCFVGICNTQNVGIKVNLFKYFSSQIVKQTRFKDATWTFLERERGAVKNINYNYKIFNTIVYTSYRQRKPGYHNLSINGGWGGGVSTKSVLGS